MTRLGVVAEGQTEAEFVRQVLAHHLRSRNIEAMAVIMDGNVSVQRLAHFLAKLYRPQNAVTSLVDFYGFRGKGGATVVELQESIRQQVLSSSGGGWDGRNVIPYVQKHEFEALLYSAPEAFAKADVSEQAIDALKAECARFETPEDINDHSPPSKRIVEVAPHYNKVADGAVIAAEIGIERMRAACPRFHVWLGQLEELGS